MIRYPHPHPRRRLVATIAAAALCLSISDRALGEGAYLGLYAQSNSNVLDASNAMPGATVTRVVENSPAEGAGVKAGDVVLRVGGQPIADAARLEGIVEAGAPGDVLELEVERDRRVLKLAATLAPRVQPPPDPDAPAEAVAPPPSWIERERLGAEFVALSAEDSVAIGLEARQGVRLSRVAKPGPLAKAGIAPGDVLAAIDGEPIFSGEALVERIEELAPGSKIRFRVVAPDGDARERGVRLRKPPSETRKVRLPPFVNYSRSPTSSELSIPILLFKRKSFEGATRYSWLWLFQFETGASDELLEVGP